MADLSIETKAKAYGVTRTVYSYYSPITSSVRQMMEQSGGIDELFRDASSKKQDRYHEEFLDAWVNWVSPIFKFNTYALHHRYPTNGSSEAIRDAIMMMAVQGKTLHVWEGEYEGYEAYAKAYNVPVIKHSRRLFENEQVVHGLDENGVFILSQPSSINGNIWVPFYDFLDYLYKSHPNVEVYLDVCYIGCCADYFPFAEFNIKYFPNVTKVFFSLSKIFGVYYFRIGGVFSKDEMPGLYGNMWFKNVYSLTFGQKLMETFGVCDIPKMLKPFQLQFVDKLNEHNMFGNAQPSNVVLLANKYQPFDLDNNVIRAYDDHFRRNKEYIRYCLTPCFETLSTRTRFEFYGRD